MNSDVKKILFFIIWSGIVLLIDKANFNTKQNALEFFQNKLLECERSVEKNKSGKDVLFVEKLDENTIAKLLDWGIEDVQNIYTNKFIVNSTGWYWIIHKNSGIYVLKLKYVYPLNNQYLYEHYAECLHLSNEYKTEYNEEVKELRSSDGIYLPVKLIQYPRYKSKILVEINSILYIAGWILLFYFSLYFFKKWKIHGISGILALKWLSDYYSVLSLLDESWLFDVKIYAFPYLFLISRFGNAVISISWYFLLAYHYRSYKYISIWNIFLGLLLLIGYIYVFTTYSSFSIHLPDLLFFNYPYWLHTILAILILLSLIVSISLLIIKVWYQKFYFNQTFVTVLVLLLLSSLLIFFKQKKDVQNKSAYLLNWIETEKELKLFEQAQIIDKNLNLLTSLNDSIYFKCIQNIENTSIYLQLTKRFLFEDSTSAFEYLKNKEKILTNVYFEKNYDTSYVKNKSGTNHICCNSIYYLQKIGTKFLISEFDYISPFSETFFYSLLSDNVFQLSSGFRNFNVAIYENNILQLKIGNIHFPVHYEYSKILNASYPDFYFDAIIGPNKVTLIAYPKLTYNHLIALFSALFIFLLTICFICGYGYYCIKFKSIFPLSNVSYTYKIIGVVLLVLLISFYLLLFFSYQYLHQNLNNEIKIHLLQKYNRSNDYEYTLLYNDKGHLIPDNSHSVLFRLKLIPSFLDKSIINQLYINKLLFVRREIEKFRFTSLLVYEKNNNQNVIREIPYFDEMFVFEKKLYNSLLPLLNIYSLLFLISFLLAILLSNYILHPIRNIAASIQKNYSDLSIQKINYVSNDELGELVISYNNLADKLQTSLVELKKEQQEKAWKIMAQQIAHDIKNSLTPLYLNAEFLKKQIQDSKSIKIIDSILHQITLLSKTAEDFSEFSQDIHPKYESVHLPAFLENISSAYQSFCEIELFNLSANADIFIYTEPYLLSRVFNNLIKNAIEAMDNKGKILITLSENQDEIIVSIKDNGRGIPPELFDKIFEPKFSTKTSGKGLGLSIVKNICNQLSIKVDFESQINAGTTFYLRFKKE